MSDDGPLKFLLPTTKAPTFAAGYLLFAGSVRLGGWEDFKSRHETQTEAEMAGEEFSWWHIVDVVTFDVVARSEET